VKLVHLLGLIIKKSDDSFQFEFLFRPKLYTSVFLDRVQFVYAFLFLLGKQYDIKVQLDHGQFSLPTARKSKTEESENERACCDNLYSESSVCV
jgi:hypothetical protein